MKKFLIVVDMQNDFVNGALGTEEAMTIVPNVVKKIREFEGQIFVTFDTHFADYMDTAEGKKLPVRHCIHQTNGWQLNPEVANALQNKDVEYVEKITFGSVDLPLLLREKANGQPFSVELIGLCTDICVVSNALLLKANFPETEISVDSACCAGVTPATHEAALSTMRCCQIDVH